MSSSEMAPTGDRVAAKGRVAAIVVSAAARPFAVPADTVSVTWVGSVARLGRLRMAIRGACARRRSRPLTLATATSERAT